MYQQWEHGTHFRLLERFVDELERPSHVNNAAHHCCEFFMKDLAQPFLRFFEVRVKEASEQGEVLVDIPAGHRKSDATGNEANYSDCMAHPRPVLPCVLGQHDSPTWQ